MKSVRRIFVIYLISILAALWPLSYDERQPETTDERIMRLCGELGVGTVGGNETLEEFEQ